MCTYRLESIQFCLQDFSEREMIHNKNFNEAVNYDGGRHFQCGSWAGRPKKRWTKYSLMGTYTEIEDFIFSHNKVNAVFFISYHSALYQISVGRTV